jgi:hypothetical protein
VLSPPIQLVFPGNLHDELVGLTDGRGHASNRAPRVHDGLTSSHRATGLQGTVFEAPHHLKRPYKTRELADEQARI